MTLSSFPSEPFNDICRTLIAGVQEIVGPDEARDIFQQARLSFESMNVPGISALENAFEERYGLRSGQGMALRSGRASFKYGLRQWGAEIGMTDIAYHLLPPGRKIRVGLEKIGALLHEGMSISVGVREDPGAWYWQSGCCSFPHGREGNAAGCHLLVGLLQEFVSWAGGSRYYRVVETECMANGAEICIFQIDKKPIE